MTPYEWFLFIAIIDGPLIGAIWFIWRKIKIEIENRELLDRMARERGMTKE